jgi:hypothetical protein
VGVRVRGEKELDVRMDRVWVLNRDARGGMVRKIRRALCSVAALKTDRVRDSMIKDGHAIKRCTVSLLSIRNSTQEDRRIASILSINMDIDIDGH